MDDMRDGPYKEGGGGEGGVERRKKKLYRG